MSGYTILKSDKKGFCVFANKIYTPGETIGDYLSPFQNEHGREVILGVWETILGRYCNHNNNPNTKILQDNNIFFIVANDLINIGEEITVNYREVEKLLNVEEGRFVNENMTLPPLSNYGTKSI